MVIRMRVLRQLLDLYALKFDAPEVKYAARQYEKQLISVARAEPEYRKAEKKHRLIEQLVDWRVGGY